MVDVVFLLLGCLCHGNFCRFLAKLEIRVVLISKGLGCQLCGALELGKHGRGTGGAAPASDTVGRGDAQGTPLPARPAASGHVDPTWFSPTRADVSRHGFDARRREPIRADSDLNRPISAEIADSGRNSKKKKKPRTHRFTKH